MTIQYTKQWVRITDTLRPMIGLGISIIIAGLVFVPFAFFSHSQLLPSLAAGGLTFAVSALVALVFIRTRKVLSINLGERQVKFHNRLFTFSDIETVTSSPHHVTLQTVDGELLRVPVFWVSKDHLRIIDRMLHMLDNEKVRTGALTIIQEQVAALNS